MMNRKEFQDYLRDNVKDYLPDSYADAEITFNEVIKNNDMHLTGISISKPGDVLVPNIYIENFWQNYQDGMDIDEIVGIIADTRIEYEPIDFTNVVDIHALVSDYDQVKNYLQTRICDSQENEARLQGLVHTEHGDFSATYHINISNLTGVQDAISSIAIQPDMLDAWGVSVEQLHEDALRADLVHNPHLYHIEDMMEGMILGTEPPDYLGTGVDLSGAPGIPMFIFTNEDMMNAASLILQKDIMHEIGEMFGKNFYIIPSSIHETLLVPELEDVSLKEISNLVQVVNQSEVTAEDRLSDRVQIYDRDAGIFMNAEMRENQMEQQKAETKIAKQSKGIRARLDEKKQKREEKKADKSTKKTKENDNKKPKKKNKGEEL